MDGTNITKGLPCTLVCFEGKMFHLESVRDTVQDFEWRPKAEDSTELCILLMTSTIKFNL